MSALKDRIGALIKREGPMSVARYMDLCLNDPAEGYYATRPDLGERGDFITAPMISQMFGELIGLWLAQVWAGLDRPHALRLVEMGPGLGVMMADILRAIRAQPGFAEACEVWLVEPSAPLRVRQAETLAGRLPGLAPPRWVSALSDIPGDLPVLLVANEVLDCLPILQAVRGPDGWRERRIDLGDNGALVLEPAGLTEPPAPPPTADLGSVFEWSPALVGLGRAAGALIRRAGGAGLFIDYGRGEAGVGDTLQALRAHGRVDPLASPGEADLTAHVDFPAFLAAARAAGAAASAPLSQAEFLARLGIHVRAARLAQAHPAQAAQIARQLERLVAPDQMGDLFKVAALASPGLALPVFEAAP